MRWPVGFIDPFKPNSRFEVNHWRYFDNDRMFGDVDTEPVTQLTEAENMDLDEVQKTAFSALKKEDKELKDSDVTLRTGFKRHDPKRGWLKLGLVG